MAMPYHCLHSYREVLFAARGSSIDSFNLQDGTLLSSWVFPQEKKPESSKELASVSSENHKPEISEGVVVESSPPAKRRKLSEAGNDTSSEPTNERSQPKHEKNGTKKGNKRSDAVVTGLDTPAIIALTATRDGRHVIAVTGEDKSIRVYENGIDETGKQSLKQLSQRSMPKRPCAIALIADDSTIISADKFGDVYSLPLHMSPAPALSTPLPSTPTPEVTKPFVSAANHLTVHSQRNRKALENQRNQANKPPEKSEPTFEHKLLLGHVSLLTDLALATSPEGRNYILTADRDEHIRVSRGIPQAHIIENFCLCHTEFISRLCIPEQRPEVLISGGGDDELFVWDWMNGKLIGKTDLNSHVATILEEVRGQAESADETLKIAVSSIKHLRSAGGEDLIVVSCEGIPALFTFLLSPQNELEFIKSFRTSGNVLDVEVLVTGGIIVSIDTIHKPASTTERREATEGKLAILHMLRTEERGLVPATKAFEVAEDEVKERGQLTNLFYNLEQLRKREEGKEEEE